MEIQTPAIIFPAISMLMLAYTNRFMVISQRIRTLYDRYRQKGSAEDGVVLIPQIANLKLRITLIRWMQAMGAISFITCSSSILMILTGVGPVRFTFGVSILLLISLVIALWEITISTKAIEIELKNIEHALK